MESSLFISFEQGPLEDVANKMAEELKSGGLKAELDCRKPSGPRAGLDWVLPTVFILLVTQSYFKSFFGEMGKDHYQLFKRAFLHVYKALLAKEKTVVYKLIGTKNKLHGEDGFSPSFSILIRLNSGHKIKFLFEETLTEEEFYERIELIINLMNAINQGTDGSEYLIDTEINPRWGIIPIAYDSETKKLKVLNPGLPPK